MSGEGQEVRSKEPPGTTEPPSKRPRLAGENGTEEKPSPSMGGIVSSATATVSSAAETTMLTVRSCKMVLVVRADLGMGKGKMCAQAAHAAIAAYKLALNGDARQKKCLQVWGTFGSTKITVKVNSQQELLDLYQRAVDKDITAAYIQDAGHTQVDPGTITVLAIGPEETSVVDSLTSHLKLL
jgi:peptidyl-tRNA hydrolase, PTH2 family